MKTSLSILPKVKDVYITMLPGNDFKEVAIKAKELVQSGFNPIPHFPARSIKNLDELKSLFPIKMGWKSKGWVLEEINKKRTDQMSLF